MCFCLWLGNVLTILFFDVCLFCHFSGIFIWWPWFTSAINFNDLSNLPTLVTIDSFVCESDNHPDLSGNRLNLVYLSGTEATLEESESPYYVTSNVVIQKNATVNVENGVEIIFVGDYEITVRGHLNACYDVDTSDDNSRGLYLVTTTQIYSNGTSQMGQLRFDYDNGGGLTKGSFCNVLFEQLYTAILLDSEETDILVDNCEINNVYYAISGDGDFSNHPLISDTIIHDVYYVHGDGEDVEFDNCLMYDFTGVTRYTYRRFYIYNSEIIGDGTQTCVVGDSVSELKNTVIDNCNIAMQIQSFYGNITFNNFTNNNISIYYTYASGDNGVISYNNFIDNTINVDYAADSDFDTGYPNYWGIETENQTLIADTIKDICSGDSSGVYCVLISAHVCMLLDVLYVYFDKPTIVNIA